MNKKAKREAGRLKAEDALAQTVASGLEAQKADRVRREEQERLIAGKAKKLNAEYEARLAGKILRILEKED